MRDYSMGKMVANGTGDKILQLEVKAVVRGGFCALCNNLGL